MLSCTRHWPEMFGCCGVSYEKEGWPASMYGVSKLCEATYSRVLAEQLKPRAIAVYACCPGCGMKITCLALIPCCSWRCIEMTCPYDPARCL